MKRKRKPDHSKGPQQQKPHLLAQKTQANAFVPPMQPFSILRQYSDEELAFIIRQNPSFMATDAKSYTDPLYVRRLCEIYCLVAENTTEPLTRIKHFKIEDLEKAILKMAKEHPEQYQHLCKTYGVNPKTKHAAQKHLNDGDHSDILLLSSWGYVETFLPNILDTIERVSKKMYSSHEISNIEKAKYAHIFFLFIYSFNVMPYDLNKYYKSLLSATQNGVKLKHSETLELLKNALADIPPVEPITIFEAVMLQNAYGVLLQNLPDNSVNIDMLKAFINDIIEYEDSLRIKEFVGMLTAEETEEFRLRSLIPIQYNTDVRAIKERIFPQGGWFTDFKLFLKAQNDESFNKAVKAAWNKFEKNSYKFGAGVEPLKVPLTLTHAGSKTNYTYYGYLYCRTPKRIRISDPNELWMMRFYLRNNL